MSLQVELVLGLLAYGVQIGSKSSLRDRFGIVVVVLLTLDEGPGILRRDDAWRMTEPAERSGDEMRAETRLHPDDASRQLLKCLDQRQSLDLPAEGDLASMIKADKVENVLADIDADDAQF